MRSLLWEFHSDLNNEDFQPHAEVTIALAKAVKSLREHACLSKLTLVLGFVLFKDPTSISALRDQTMPIKRIVETIGPQLGELKDFFIHIRCPLRRDIDRDRSVERELEQLVKGADYNSVERGKTLDWDF